MKSLLKLHPGEKQCTGTYSCGEWKPATKDFFYVFHKTGKFDNTCIECRKKAVSNSRVETKGRNKKRVVYTRQYSPVSINVESNRRNTRPVFLPMFLNILKNVSTNIVRELNRRSASLDLTGYELPSIWWALAALTAGVFLSSRNTALGLVDGIGAGWGWFLGVFLTLFVSWLVLQLRKARDAKRPFVKWAILFVMFEVANIGFAFLGVDSQVEKKIVVDESRELSQVGATLDGQIEDLKGEIAGLEVYVSRFPATDNQGRPVSYKQAVSEQIAATIGKIRDLTGQVAQLQTQKATLKREHLARGQERDTSGSIVFWALFVLPEILLIVWALVLKVKKPETLQVSL